MKLKPVILNALSRDDLKQIVDNFDFDGVDRRSVESMRSLLARSRRVSPDDLLGLLRKDSLQTVCQSVGLPVGGNREFQQQLFDEPDREKHRELDRVADEIMAKFGKLAIRRGARLDTDKD